MKLICRQIQSVALAGNQLNLTLAAVYYLEEFIDVCNVLYFHSDSPLSFLFLL